MKVKMEVMAKEWGSVLRDGWRPAIAGFLNQTSLEDEQASEFPNLGTAMQFLKTVREQHPDRIRIVGTRHGTIFHDEILPK